MTYMLSIQQVAHRGLHLNDNGDGTLSVVSEPAWFSKQRSIVISQISRSEDELEPIAKCVPYTKDGSRPSLPNERSESAGLQASASSLTPQKGDAEAMMKYIRPFLQPQTLEVILRSQHVQECLELPKVRDIEWNNERMSRLSFKEVLPRDVSSLIIQATGEPAPKPCSYCSNQKGPYIGCIVISQTAPLGLQERITSWYVVPF